jgi:hypothetical protein
MGKVSCAQTNRQAEHASQIIRYGPSQIGHPYRDRAERNHEMQLRYRRASRRKTLCKNVARGANTHHTNAHDHGTLRQG